MNNTASKLELIRFEDAAISPIGDSTYSQVCWKSLAACSTAQARSLISYELALDLSVLPIQVLKDSRGESSLSLIAAEDTSEANLAKIKFIAGMPILVEFVSSLEIGKAISKAYDHAQEALSEALVQVRKQNKNDSDCFYQELLSEVAKHPIPKLLQALIKISLEQESSDLHLEPLEKSYRVRLRVNGVLSHSDKLAFSKSVAVELISHIKVLSKLDTTKHAVAQEGAFDFTHSGNSIRLRVSIYPQINGEKVVLRILDNNVLTKLEKRTTSSFQFLGLSPSQEQLFTTFLESNEGTILISGPTGSGKSTLLYAALEYLNDSSRNIVTIEDPVERILEGLNQSEINPKLGIDYPNLLSPLLRQDPDVVMLGEIRAKSTADTALTAGITGHLVLSTVHAGNCFEVITRLEEFQVSRQLLALSLKLIVSQRLVRANCEHCKEEIEVSEKFQDFFKAQLSTVFFQSKGCQLCNFSGVGSRVGVYEVLPLAECCREKILCASGSIVSPAFKEASYSVGYRPFSHAVRDVLLSGVVSPQAALKTLGISAQFFK